MTTTVCVNLIPAWRHAQRRRRARRRAWAVAASLYAALLAVGYTGWRFAWADDDCDAAQQLALVQGDIDATEKTISQLQGELRRRQMTLQVSQSIAAQPDWSILLALAAQLRGDDVVLSRCDLDTGNRPATALPVGAAPNAALTFHVQGFGRTQAAVSQLALRLERTGLFQSVTLLKSNREPFLTAEAVGFRLECALKTDADPRQAPPPGSHAGSRGVAGVSTSEAANP